MLFSFLTFLCHEILNDLHDVDAVREMWKYHAPHIQPPSFSNNPMAEAVYNMKMFRGQRNYYISIFAVMMFV